MKMLRSFSRGRFDVPCTVEIEHSASSLHAHVEIDSSLNIEPGDCVFIHDAPTSVPFGGQAIAQRTATIVRAGWFERLSIRFVSHFELTQLFEVSFSERTRL